MTKTPKKGRSYPPKDIKILWGLSAGRCAHPGCRRLCVLDETSKDLKAVAGIAAHIVGHSESGPRADPSYPAERRDRYENLILLCPNHHEEIDKQENTYSVEDLRKFKREHERWVKEELAEEMPNVGFAELELVCDAVLHTPVAAEINYDLPSLEEKLLKNSLSSIVRSLLEMGLAKSREVGRFVEEMSMTNPTFADNLVAGFKSQYESLLRRGLEGDQIFVELHQFAGGNSHNVRRSAAALAVVGYLFLKCEIFEK